MKVLAEICIIPIHGSISLRNEVALAHAILKETGCHVELHAYGTNIEGDYDVIMAAIKHIHTTLHDRGTMRIHTSLKISSRVDKEQRLKDKVQAVETILKESI